MTSASTAWFTSSVGALRTSPPRRPGIAVSQLVPSRSPSMSYVFRRAWSRSRSNSGRWCGTAPEARARAVVALMHHRTGQVFPRWRAAAVAAGLLLGGHLGEQRDAPACPQAGGFGDHGGAGGEGGGGGTRG